MKKRLLKIMNIFIGASIILLNVKINANPTKAYQIRQKMELFLQKEKKNEKVGYKYLAEQLCVRLRTPEFADEELTFCTPFGETKISLNSTKSIFITNRPSAYDEIKKILDEILTHKGRKKLAEIILEYLETRADANYLKKTFNEYKFNKHENFFSIENRSYFKIESNSGSDSNDIEKLSQKMENLTIDDKSDTQDKINEKKLKKARHAAKILCAILMLAEPCRPRSFDGGKHERALIRDIAHTGMTFTEAFEKFIPSKKGGGQLAYIYSTDETGTNEILESEYYSDDEDEKIIQRHKHGLGSRQAQRRRERERQKQEQMLAQKQ